MLTNINPKLPMRNKAITRDFYVNKLGFRDIGSVDFDGYLIVQKDKIEIHFFEFKELDPKKIMDKFISVQTTLKHFTNQC